VRKRAVLYAPTRKHNERKHSRGGRCQRDAVNLWEEVARDSEEGSRRRLRWRMVMMIVVIRFSKDARWVVVHRNCRALAALMVVAP